MPANCAPWPVKRKATFGGVCPALSWATCSGFAPEANADRPAASACVEPPATASRYGMRVRMTLEVKHTSAASSSGWAVRYSPWRRAMATSASSPRAESVSRCAGRGAGTFADAAGAGASSRMMCAFVPLMPNALTPASRGAAERFHGWSSVGTKNGVPSSRIRGLSRLKFRCLGMASCWSASTVFMRPAMPAAASRWPRFVFTDPSAHREPSDLGLPSTSTSASTSIGSPSGVPVPCAST